MERDGDDGCGKDGSRDAPGVTRLDHLKPLQVLRGGAGGGRFQTDVCNRSHFRTFNLQN